MNRDKLDADGFAIGITANDAERSIKFYVDGLGFEVESRNDEGGVFRFAMLRGGNAHIGIGADDFAKGRDRSKGIGIRIWITTKQDIKALAERVKAAGITLDSEPMQLPWGPTAFAVTDPDGIKLTIASGM